MFSAYKIITKKRDGEELTEEEIKWFIKSLISGEVANYQMTALLMAIFINGFSLGETAALTDSMLYSGKILDFNCDHVVDKHSTGGIGDKTSFILAPIASACGVKVPMIAGRGLGHTGGTIDKVESISGFQTQMPLSKFVKELKNHGLALMGQTEEIAPADKIIYGLMDVTATIDSVPLITASIMSKKLAEGAQGIVMDIKVGSAAFMKNKTQAKKLAKSLRQTGHRFNRNMMTVLSDMNQPLGNCVGHSLEMIESIETLKGQGPKDLTTLSLHLAGGMIYLSGLAKTHNAGIKKAKQALSSGEALNEFEKMITRQGGNEKVIYDYSLLPTSETTTQIKAKKAGYISKMNATEIGNHVVALGGGRKKSTDLIDFGIGLTFEKKIGSRVKSGDTLLKIHHRKTQSSLVKKIEETLVSKDIKISDKRPKISNPLILETEVAWAKELS